MKNERERDGDGKKRNYCEIYYVLWKEEGAACDECERYSEMRRTPAKGREEEEEREEGKKRMFNPISSFLLCGAVSVVL